MSKSESNSVDQAIRDDLVKRDLTSIAGAALAELLKNLEIDYKANGQTLTEFIRANVPDLVVVGTAGQDKRYSFSTTVSDTSSAVPRAKLPIWKEFASPNGSRRIVWNIRLRACDLLSDDASVSDSTVPLGRMSTADLTSIAIAFSLEQPQGAFGQQDAVIREAITKNKQDWFTQLKNASPQHISSWNKYRIDRIEETFKTRLTDGLVKLCDPEELRESVQIALIQLRESRSQSRSVSGNSLSNVGPRIGRSIPELRDLAHAAVDQMSEADLARLWVPLGSVYQQIRKSQIN
jgi:hypothetical protein